MTSPLLGLPGAVAAAGVDQPVAAHYGSFNAEQRQLVAGAGFVDLSHHDVIRVAGPDRLSWLHSLTTQYFEDLEPGRWMSAMILSPQGHVEHLFTGADSGGESGEFTAHTEPGRGAALVEFLDRMRFLLRVEVSLVTERLALCRRGSGATDLVPREQLTAYAEAAGPACGLWAYEALRIARGEPRLGIDTDHRTIPNELGLDWAVHLDKGCYRGQETVARVHNLGKPPRMLVLLHLDGSTDRPATGDPITAGGRAVGRLGTVVDHVDLGPIALGLVKRTIPVDTDLSTGDGGSVAARIDPDSVPADDGPGAGRLAVDRLRDTTAARTVDSAPGQ